MKIKDTSDGPTINIRGVADVRKIVGDHSVLETKSMKDLKVNPGAEISPPTTSTNRGSSTNQHLPAEDDHRPGVSSGQPADTARGAVVGGTDNWTRATGPWPKVKAGAGAAPGARDTPRRYAAAAASPGYRHQRPESTRVTRQRREY